jgi:Tol biopolymer transport system component/imidazolonepropionase-like amidohydrolase
MAIRVVKSRWAMALLLVAAVLTIVVGGRRRIGLRQTSAESRPLQPLSREVTVDQGTNMSLAAIPNGSVLVTDLLGSLWTVPVQGGRAKRITEELLESRRPALSPDGRQIAFEGYLDDGWDIWRIAPDGSGAGRLTWGPFDDREPRWSHDGTRIAFSSDRSANYDLWVLDTRSGDLRQVTRHPEQDSQPAWSPDDRELVFVSTRSAPGRRDAAVRGPSAAQGSTVWTVDVQSGAERFIAAVEGRVSAPTWAPDGKQVLYNVIADSGSRIESSGKSVVSGEDVFPFPVQWVSRTEFLYTSDGKIKKRALASTTSQIIEFSATLPVQRAQYTKKRRNFDSTEPRPARGIVRPSIHPDGSQVAFAAVGDLWLMTFGSEPKRVTNDPFVDADPAWSPDGARLVFSSDRAGIGNIDLWLRDMKTGADRRLTQLPTGDFGAAFSPDGKRVAFLSLLSHSSGADVYVLDVESGALKKIHHFPERNPSSPTWSPDGRLVMVAAFYKFAERFRESVYRLVTIPVDGGEVRWLDQVLPHGSHIVDSGVDAGPVWSPDGTRVAIAHQGLLKVLEVDRTGNPTGPLRQLSTDAAHAPSWTRDSRHILYLATDQLKMVTLSDGRARDIPLNLTYRLNLPTGRAVVHAGRLWTGREQTLQQASDIVIEGNRITQVGPHADRLHTGTVMDASEGTVLPGLIDMHAHVYREYGEALWRLLLSYGVTTGRETAGFPYRSLEYREAIESGARPGPRLYLSAPTFDGTRSAFAEMYTIDDGPRLEREFQRARHLDYDLLKLYVRLPQPLQKRAVELAHSAGMHVTSHFLYPAAAFGSDGTEHGKASATGHTYNDVTNVFIASRMGWCPTLALTGFAVVALDDPSFLSDERLRVLLADWAIEPARQRVARLREGGPQLLEQTLNRIKRQGAALATVLRGGGLVVAGTDAPGIPHGAALLAELESYVLAGLTPFEALQTATVHAAAYLGAEADLGALEPGKLADLVIIDGNPLSDIRSLRKVRTVIKDGRVFEMRTLLQGPSRGADATAMLH